MNYGIIMAGGAGARLWPLSRADRPKQLLPIVNGQSLLRLAYERLHAMLPPERIYVCTAARHAPAVAAELPELPRQNLLGEPEGRDTAAAVGFTAAVLARHDPDAALAIVTADHIIEPAKIFHQAIQTAFDVVARRPEALVTFGIIPTHAHTGLGYIHRGESLESDDLKHVYRVLAFQEKPDRATADRYVESGRYYWNSGMFVWRAAAVLDELNAHLPATGRALRKIADAWGGQHQDQVLREVYPTLQRISIDYAVMEPASRDSARPRVLTVEMPVQWLDIGSWPALAEILPTDPHDNATGCEACVFLDSDNNVVISDTPGHLVATVGVSDMVIIHTRDATMICPKDQAQRVKQLATKVKETFPNRYQ